MKKMIKLGILGADGSMGKMITGQALEDPELKIIHAYTIPESPNIGKDLGLLVGKGDIKVPIVDTINLEADCKENPPDIVIDFTVAAGTEKNGLIPIKNGIPIVIGTTGLAKSFHTSIESLCKETKVSSVVATNMAVGVNIFFKIAAEITKYVKNWDIEVIEAHHHRKKDAPSGTAMTVATKIAEVLEQNIDEIGKFGRSKGPNTRKIGAEEIGVHAIRAGDIVGDHTVLYAGPGERIELIHRAHTREGFAAGTLKAAKFLFAHKTTGKTYNMQDVLGI
jgi:4-hydroxy-tetrahydrodipicolinate reductase